MMFLANMLKGILKLTTYARMLKLETCAQNDAQTWNLCLNLQRMHRISTALLNDVQLKKHLLSFISTTVSSNGLLILKDVTSVTRLKSEKILGHISRTLLFAEIYSKLNKL